MAKEIKNQDIEKWALDISKKINRENDLENVYFSCQKKILQLKQEMKKSKIPHK